MTQKARLFVEANAKSPVVYASCDENGCTYRLRDGTRFDLSAVDAQAIDASGEMIRWSHLGVAR